MDAVTVSGRRITYRRTGRGDPLVLLHGGFGFDSRAWEPQLDALADRFDVVAWDAPGAGGSDDPPEDFTLDDYADTLAGFVSALGLDRPHVLGLSFGGGVALALATRHPKVPRSLVLCGAYAGWAGSLSPDEVDRRLRRATDDVTRDPDVWLPEYVPGLLAPAAPTALRTRTLDLMAGVHPRASLTMLEAMAGADLRDALGSIRVPTLVLHGELDVRAPLPVAAALHEAIPGSRLVVLPGVGHLSNVESPDAFTREVQTFLADAGSPA
ncbi:alpha/beta fold hydrolase [Isoptericola sediminis]|uniref:Alpha/beta fold hydrolase n=1 Tax=Isoptericola sediminis TaxID=2733572 RepID=A0A849JR44_9MICO|nr:alpha/beta fold hydrolase [Isoptericola sediminis]NNU25936.1 alpha/beta fold hydrolase [Isoptericola sediminis]